SDVCSSDLKECSEKRRSASGFRRGGSFAFVHRPLPLPSFISPSHKAPPNCEQNHRRSFKNLFQLQCTDPAVFRTVCQNCATPGSTDLGVERGGYAYGQIHDGGKRDLHRLGSLRGGRTRHL